jgi:hypothetical protein
MDVNNDRIIGRALFGFKDLRNGLGIEGIGSQTIDCFGGEGDKTAAANNLPGQSHNFRCGLLACHLNHGCCDVIGHEGPPCC